MGGCFDIFTLIYPFSPLSPFLWEILSQRAVKPKTTNQPISYSIGIIGMHYCTYTLNTKPIFHFYDNYGRLLLCLSFRSFTINTIMQPDEVICCMVTADECKASTTQRGPSVSVVWTILGSRCTDVACSLGFVD